MDFPCLVDVSDSAGDLVENADEVVGWIGATLIVIDSRPRHEFLDQSDSGPLRWPNGVIQLRYVPGSYTLDCRQLFA